DTEGRDVAPESEGLTDRPDPLAVEVEPGELTRLADAGLKDEETRSRKREGAGAARRGEPHALGDRRRLANRPPGPGVEALHQQVSVTEKGDIARVDIASLALTAEEQLRLPGLAIEGLNAGLLCSLRE